MASDEAIGGSEAEPWGRYAKWMRGCWPGRVSDVLAEHRCPKLQEHIHRLVEPLAQADPKFRTALAYTRITARAVRQALQAVPELEGQ